VKDMARGRPAYSDKLFGVFQGCTRQDEFEGTALDWRRRADHSQARRTIWAESTPGVARRFYFTLAEANQHG